MGRKGISTKPSKGTHGSSSAKKTATTTTTAAEGEIPAVPSVGAVRHGHKSRNKTPPVSSKVKEKSPLAQEQEPLNGQKYLHKKFKRVASTVVDEVGSADVLGTESESPSEAEVVTVACDNDNTAAIVNSPRTAVLGEGEGCSSESDLRPVQSDHLRAPSQSPPESGQDRLLFDGGENGDSLSSTSGGLQQQQQQQPSNNNIGRNVCHFCNLNCIKPSVLEKHIRSHTNERPYPCTPCGFAFKTKSNLYKHCRSRAHQLRSQGAEVPPGQLVQEDDLSVGSDQELSSSASGSEEISRATSPVDEAMMGPVQQTDKPYKPKFHKAVLYNEQQQQHQLQPLPSSTLQPSQTSADQFRVAQEPLRGEEVPSRIPVEGEWSRPIITQQHGVPLQQQAETLEPSLQVPQATPGPSATATASTTTQPPMPSGHVPPRLSHLASQPYNLEQHISKLISRNEAIITDVEPALQKKYHKITGKSRGNSLDLNAPTSVGSKAQAAAMQQLQQFQAKALREESLATHLLGGGGGSNQYNHLARRASTPAGISLSNNQYATIHVGPPQATPLAVAQTVAGSPAPMVNSSAKTGRTKATPVPQQPLNLCKPITATPHARGPAKSTVNVEQGTTNPLPAGAQQKTVHNVSSLTTLITNKLKNTNIPYFSELIENLRKQFSSAEVAGGCATDINVSSHPQNPERSIIKGLLLDWKNVSIDGLLEGGNKEGGAPPNGLDGNAETFVCPVCKITFRSADTLQTHVKNYCQGNGIDKFSPTTLVNLARYKLRTTPANQKNPSPLAKLAQSMLKRNHKQEDAGSSTSSAIVAPVSVPRIENNTYSAATSSEFVAAPLPSPGPLLGKTRLVDSYPSKSEQARMPEISVSVRQQQSFVPSFTQTRQLQVKAIPEPLSLASSQRGVASKTMPVVQANREMFGGELQSPQKRQNVPKEFHLEFTGGSIVSESPLSDTEPNQISIRTPGLFSGGKVEKSNTSRSSPPITPLTPSLLVTPNQYTPSFMVAGSHFQFPPINSITAYNPLTLPTIPSPIPIAQHAAGMKVFGGRLIPDVPGMPGPETMHLRINPPTMLPNTLAVPSTNTASLGGLGNRSPSPLKVARGLKRSNSSTSPVNVITSTLMAPPPTNGFLKTTVKIEGGVGSGGEEKIRNAKERKTSRPLIWSPANLHSDNKKSFVFSRQAEKEDQRLDETTVAEAGNKVPRGQLHVDVYTEGEKVPPPKFLRPSSLSLEPGTFTPKRHHGITPTANTLPLISPETPRPSKSCVQLYINGQAYTYLGLKCSTKPFYCTVNKTQPIYLPHHIRTISMYSQWQVCAESSPHPLGLKPGAVIGLYDSRQSQQNYSSAVISSGARCKDSQGPIMTPFVTQRNLSIHHHVTRCPTPPPLSPAPTTVPVSEPMVESQDAGGAADGDESLRKDSVSGAPVSVYGGYESNEDYEYIKGRGYGRFVCETCGIRCRKPSMLKKHIRTHTNIRPFTCQYCCFSFKTKGNLTKHMKSKSHAKKCEELGVCPVPTAEDMMESTISVNGKPLLTVPGDSDSEEDTDGDDASEGSDTEDIKARLPQEQEAARGLLSLSMTPPMLMSHAQDTAHSAVQPQSQLPMDRLGGGEDLSVKSQIRPLVVSVPKVTFEFPRPEQYYSNPNIVKPPSLAAGEPADADLPMDLTKPRAVERPISGPVCPKLMEPAGLISSLVSITDKIPHAKGNVVAPGVDEIALQLYLTECAMKHQQQKKEYQSTTKCEVDESTPVLHRYVSGEPMRGQELEDTKDVLLVEAKQEPLSTAADLPTESAVDRNTTAKFVASEYLKMATQRSSLKSDREDGESSSDQEVVSSEGNRKRADSISDVLPRTVVVVAKDAQKSVAEFVNLATGVGGVGAGAGAPQPPCRIPSDDGRSVCEVCRKTFQKPSQLKLHMNIHYLERKFRCEPCGVSFRTQGHLHKHERSVSHHNKVSMTTTFGVATTVNPRPFNCTDCRVAFRIHGHLAKHLRSKMHVLRLECLCKVPFGTYAEIERAGINLTAIDTKDCDTFLASLIALVKQLPELNVMAEGGGSKASAGGVGDSDNEGSDGGNENGERASQLDENKNGAVKRKFGTLLKVTEETDDDQSEQDGASLDVNSDGGGSGPASVMLDEGGGNSDVANVYPLEKRIKVN